MIDIVEGLSQIVEEGVENDDNVGPGNRGRPLELQCMWIELSMKRNERAYIVPDDTIFNAPFRKFSSPSLFLSANHPFCDARLHSLDLQFIVVQFTLGTVVDGARCGWITETFFGGPQFLLKSCRLLTHKKNFCCLDVYGGAIFSDTSYMEASMKKM